MADGRNLIDELKLEKKRMKNMTPHQRWVQFRTYWMWQTIALIAVILVSISLIRGYVLSKREVIISGTTINVAMDDSASEYLTTDYLKKLGRSERKAQAKLSTGTEINFSTTEGNFMGNRMLEGIFTQISAKDIDYLIVDKGAFDVLTSNAVAADLSEILTSEQMNEIGDAAVMIPSPGKDEDLAADPHDGIPDVAKGESYPAAIDLAGTPFAEKFHLTPEECYLIFVADGAHADNASAFYTYLQSGK